MLEKIGHYEIVEELGRGGMGVVYKAHEASLNRFVAIKVLGDHLSEDDEYVTRFMREARAAAKLSHPNIVQIYFIGSDEGRHYFVMEYVHGDSLQRIIRSEGALPVQRAARIMIQAAAGLAAAHDQGIIHRDIKPGNLILNQSALVKIADFGLALAPDEATRLTSTGMFMGTPGYLSPEQCRDEEVDHRTDIYSLGVTFYEMLTGTMPFRADSPLALLRKITDVEPPPVEDLNPDVDEPVRAILARMMSKDREQRYGDAHRLGADLEEWLRTQGVLSGSASRPARAEQRDAEVNTSPTVAVGAVVPPPPGAAPPPPPPPQASAAAAVVPPPPPVAAATPPAPLAPEPVPQAVEATAVAPPRSRRGLLVAALIVVLLGVVMLAGAGVAAWRLGYVDKLAGLLPFVGGDEGGAELEQTTVAAAGEWVVRDEAAGEEAGASDAAASSPDSASWAEESEPLATDPPATANAPERTATGGASDRSTAGDGAAGAPGARAAERPRPQPAKLQDAGRPALGAAAPASPPERVARVPEAPVARGTAVVVAGERLLAGEVARYLEERLRQAGFEVVSLAGFSGEGQVDRDDLLAAARGRAGQVVIAEVEYLGDRQLSYMGRSDTAYTSRVSLSAWDVASGRALGSERGERIEYTTLNVGRSAEQALGGVAGDVVDWLR